MARKLRIQYPGAMYHVMNRGDRREAIFEDDQDRQRFLSTLGEACEKTGWQVHAFCLMSNHFHLVVETPQPNLVVGMKWLLGTYTSRHNRRHQEFGHLFSGRYKALPVDGSGNGYLKSAGDYVHLNPARARLIAPEQPLSSFAWSSFLLYLVPARRPIWLRQALERPGWTELDLANRPKGHQAKLELAHQLRAQTTLPVAWVAQRLSMGSRAHLAWLLKSRKNPKPAQPEAPGQTLLAI